MQHIIHKCCLICANHRKCVDMSNEDLYEEDKMNLYDLYSFVFGIPHLSIVRKYILLIKIFLLMCNFLILLVKFE